MKMIIFSKIWLFLLVVVTATQAFGQTPDQPKRPALPEARTTTLLVDPELLAGVLEGRTYTNEFFGFSVSLPRDWIIVGAERRQSIAAESKKMISSEDQERTKGFRPPLIAA